ncbi:MAG: amino acid ABC transporter substrate-binding protein [Candidatus Bipolaricaulota bacterium]|nr:amino acid ABC transporter substrate-binding protein [Candidatus Bipolaricaulota bacterium]
MKRIFVVGVLLMLVMSICTMGQQTLETVLNRGKLIVGVNAVLPGFGYLDTATGKYNGFDVDYGRAIAAAIGVDVEFIPLTAGERLTALQTGQIDVLLRNTTWTLTRDSKDLGLNFCPTTFYDGQGFIVRKAEGINSIEDLDGATVCVTSGTTTEGNLADAFRTHGLSLKTQVFADTEASFGAYDASGCDAYTSDKSQLASLRTTAKVPSDNIILPDTISKEPLGPVVRHGDSEWYDIVKWTVFATFFAEEHGITQANVATFESDNPSVLRFLGVEGGMGAKLGLSEDWAVNVITAVGNYGEIYNRSLGPNGLDIPRAGSLNDLWTNGGLIYCPAWR